MVRGEHPERPDPRVDVEVVYQTNHGWGCGSVLGLVGCLAMLGFGWAWWTYPPEVMDVVILLTGAVGSVLIGVSAQRRALGIRVEGKGVTVGSDNPFAKHKDGQFVPWQEIEAVLVFPESGRSAVAYVGVRRTERARRRQLDIGVLDHAQRAVMPGVPPDVLKLSTAARGWDLDRARLAEAIQANAPKVALVDLTDRGRSKA